MTNEARTPEMTEAINTMLDAFGLNWKVAKEAVTIRGHKETGFYGVVRQDTLDTFACVPSTYQPLQNDELAELLVRLCEETGYTVYNGGMFNNGAKVYMQLKTREVEGFGKNKGDIIKLLATALNSHNGHGASKWGHTGITVSCGNTFNAAMKELKNRAAHTNKLHQKIAAALAELDAVRKVEVKVLDGLQKLAGVKATRKHIIEVAQIVTGLDMSISREELEANYKTVSLDKLDTFLASVAQELGQKGETLYGLHNAVTHFTSHAVTERKEGSRAESKYTGANLKLDNEVFSKLLTFA